MWSLLAIVVVVVVLGAQSADAFAFNLVPGTKKCFQEDLSTRERVRVKYQMAMSYASFVGVTITGPDGARLFERKHAGRDHSEWIMPYKAGSYAICFSSKAKAQLSAVSTEIVLEVMDETSVQNHEHQRRQRSENAKADRRRPLMDQAQFIEQGVETLHRDYQYLKEREMAMRDTNESTNSRTIGVTVVTIIIVGVVGFLRFYTLRRHLISKKILD